MTFQTTKYKPYPAFEPSGVEWLAEVPAHWEVKRLKYTATINPRVSEVRGLASETEVSFVPMEAVGENGGLDLSLTKELADVADGYTYFSDGDVLVAKITPCFENGKGSLAEGLVNGIAFGTTELHVMRCGPTLDKRFTFYLTLGNAFRKLGEADMYGAGGQKRVPELFVEDLKHPIPPLPEQRAIAGFLDRETAKIDSLVTKKERLIELLQEKRTALISRAVTKGLDPDVPMKDSGVEWLGEVPANWQAIQLKRLCTFEYGDSLASESRIDGQFQVYGSNGPVGSHEYANTLAPCLVIGRKGSFGKVNYSSTAVFSIDTTFFVDRRCTNAVLRWLYYLLADIGLDAATKDSAIPGLDREDAYAHIVPVCDHDEQRAIAGFLDRETAKIDGLVSKIHEAIDRLKELRAALISAAVTGRIDVRGEAV